MRQAYQTLAVDTCGKGLYEITTAVRRWVLSTVLLNGLLTLFVRHTSASLLIQENADPVVLQDLERFFSRLISDGDPLFKHCQEGADDMPAHVRSALTQVQLSIPLIQGDLVLGTWQGIYLYEHRFGHQTRQVAMHLLGETD